MFRKISKVVRVITGVTNFRRASLKVALIGSAAIVALTAAAAAQAQPTAFSQSGLPGTLAYERTLAQCYLISVWAGKQPELDTDSPVAAPSPNYGLPQTIERRTRIETSADGGRTWQIWMYLPTQRGVVYTPGTGVVFLPQTVDLYLGWSYRIVEGFDFKVGTSYVGSRWYVLNRVDYSIQQNIWGTRGQPFATTFAAGCTIPSS